MLYYLFEYLDQAYDLPGAGVFQYISFRAAMAVLTSLVISLLFGKRLIRILHAKQVGETVRDLGLKGQLEKQGTPTMGGLIIIAAILVPTLLMADRHNTYVIIMILTTIILGGIGFIDDYIKVFRKNKKGLAGKFKVFGQISVGIIVGSFLFFDGDVVTKQKVPFHAEDSISVADSGQEDFRWVDEKSVKTTIPFIKNNEFDYAWLLGFLPKEEAKKWAWLIFIPIVIFIVTAVSNGANITDGLDGLATGTSAIIGLVLAIFAFVSGNLVFSDYLNIMFIPNSGELTVFISAFIGACIGFLWYNSFPAQVFMGDTGSLALGGIIAVFAIAIRKELLITILCGIFLV
jgi:phospho-N-acetylmuramoyl-pentapeptide-transferase